MLKILQFLIPLIDPEVKDWGMEARIIRWLTLIWLLIGLIVMFSASYPVADAEQGDGLYYFKRQLIWVWLGLIILNLIVRIPLKYILNSAKWGILLVLFLIILTLIPGLGTTVNGATRWISIGPIPIQPSELMKPFLVLQGANIFGRWYRYSWTTRGIWLGIFMITLGCILLQPNLSTTALCGLSLWLIALAGNLPMIYLSVSALLGAVTGVISISLQDYQRRRVMSFMDPWSDPWGDGYQLVQSLLAVGSGGTSGTGFGLSQQKLFYLPIQYTDFIFAVFAEEFGFIGGIILLILLISYASLALYVSFKTRHPVKRLVAIGVMVFMVGQSLLNIGVATGALPTTGLPLPLFSYGGSSVISSLVLAALLIRVARESNEAEIVSINN